MKRSTILLGASLAASFLAVAYVGSKNNPQPDSPQYSGRLQSLKVEKAARCKYMYDEMAHKLVAYSASETAFADAEQGFSARLGGRILKFSRRDDLEQQLFAL